MSYRIHLLDSNEDRIIPYTNVAKQNGYRMSECGYQRKHTTKELEDVTCKTCLKKYFKK